MTPIRLASMTAVCGVLLGLGLSAGLRSDASHSAVPTASPTSDAQLGSGDSADVAAELARMKNRLAALARSEQRARTAAAQPAGEPQVPLPLALIEEAAAEEAASARKIEQLDRALAAEQRDAAWADAFEHSVREVLAAEMFAGNRIDAIECGRSLCRLEVAHDDEASRTAFEDRFPREAPPNQGGFLHRVPTADGSYATEGYLARRGSKALLDVSPPDPARGP